MSWEGTVKNHCLDSGGAIREQWCVAFTKEGAQARGWESRAGETASSLRKGAEELTGEEKHNFPPPPAEPLLCLRMCPWELVTSWFFLPLGPGGWTPHESTCYLSGS